MRVIVANGRLWRGGAAPMQPVDLDDFLVWAVLGIVLGGRLGYVLFYDFARFAADPASIIAIWSGGMSFHGGLAGTTIAEIWLARSRGLPLWSLFDVIAAVAPIGLFFGRLANFINAELWGRTTDLPWGVLFPNGGDLPRHPSQLYEAALEGVVLLLVLRLLTHKAMKLKAPRFVSGAFVAGYAISRIAVEFVRQPDAQLGYLYGGWLTMGMVLSLPMLALGLWAMTSAPKADAA